MSRMLLVRGVGRVRYPKYRITDPGYAIPISGPRLGILIYQLKQLVTLPFPQTLSSLMKHLTLVHTDEQEG